MPHRKITQGTRAEFGAPLRVAADKSGWRAHGLIWRGDDFITREGDPNYLSVDLNGVPYRALRDYAEAGVTRAFALASDSWLEASLRAHRIERRYEYSFRILAVARLHLD